MVHRLLEGPSGKMYNSSEIPVLKKISVLCTFSKLSKWLCDWVGLTVFWIWYELSEIRRIKTQSVLTMQVQPRSLSLSLLSPIHAKQIKRTIVQEPFSLDKINQTGNTGFWQCSHFKMTERKSRKLQLDGFEAQQWNSSIWMAFGFFFFSCNVSY